MAAFVEIDDVSKVFPLVDGGQYIALKNIDLKINRGEFVSLLLGTLAVASQPC
jgi:nitrate/nitrite transport system ATP-binding protein